MGAYRTVTLHFSGIKLPKVQFLSLNAVELFMHHIYTHWIIGKYLIWTHVVHSYVDEYNKIIKYLSKDDLNINYLGYVG